MACLKIITRSGASFPDACPGVGEIVCPAWNRSNDSHLTSPRPIPMLRPRNGSSPEGDTPPEPDTPNSHYSPTMQNSQQLGGSGVPGDVSPLEGAFDEKTGTQVHGLGLASRRGSKPPTLSLGADSNNVFARGKGKGAKLGEIVSWGM